MHLSDETRDKLNAGRTIFGIYPPNAEAEAEFAAWCKDKGR